MFLKLRPLLYSLIFFVGLELIVFFHRHVPITLVFLLVFSFYQGKRMGGRWSFSVIPSLFCLSSVALLYLVTIGYEQQTFITLASLMYYFSLFGAYRLGQYEGDKTARGMMKAAVMSTIFFLYSGAYGLYLNFLVPLYWLMLVFLSATLFVSYQYFSIVQKRNKRMIWVYSFILAFSMAEIIWALSFWPLGYLTVGTVALILYYVLWDLVQSYFLQALSKRKVVFNMIFFSFLIALILASSRWTPAV